MPDRPVRCVRPLILVALVAAAAAMAACGSGSQRIRPTEPAQASDRPIPEKGPARPADLQPVAPPPDAAHMPGKPPVTPVKPL